MLGINEYRNILIGLDDQAIDVEAAVNYALSHDYVDEKVMDAFGGFSKQVSRAYKYTLFSFVGFNRSLGYRLSMTEFVNLAPFIFEESGVNPMHREADVDFIEFLKLYSGTNVLLQTRRSAFFGGDMFPEDLSKIYHKLIELNQTFGLDVRSILTYCLTQSNPEALRNLFDLWYDFVSCLPHDKDEALMPKNLLYAYNEFAIKNEEEPVIFPLTKYSGSKFMFRRRGNELLIRAALPVNPETNELNFKWTKLWCDKVGEIEIQSLADHKNDNRLPFGNLFYQVTIYLTPDSLVMVDDDDVNVTPRLPNQVRQHLFSGTDWVCFYEGPSRINVDTERLSTLRKAAGFTQKEAAIAVNAKPRTFQNWESKKSGATPDMESLIRLMYLYNVESIKAFVEQKKFFDIGDEKFKAGVELETIYPCHYKATLSPGDALIEAVKGMNEQDEEGGD